MTRSKYMRLGLAFAVGILAAAALESLVGCTTDGRNDSPEAASPVEDQSFGGTVERFSAGDREYNGFYNQFDFKATLHNSIVQDAMLKKQAEYYQWDAAKLQGEMAKAAADMNRETFVFCAFFTPDRRNDNLIDSKSIWRVFLDVGGKRYVGKAKKSRKLLSELQVLYPYHTRWTTPYVFIFPVPVATIEAQPASLTITGPVGSRSVTFRGAGAAASTVSAAKP